MNNVRVSRITLLLAFVGISFGIAMGLWYKQLPSRIDQKQNVTIRDFDYQRDAQFILNLFQDNMYWLVAEGSDFSPEHMLKNMAWSKEPQALGKQTIKVLYEGDQAAGFVAYHTLSFYKGRLHFLAVDEKFRSKGYGLVLVKYALDQLIKRGLTEVILVTRTNNHSAQSVYKKAGFKPGRITPDGFIYFSYIAS